jgi:hypothetical protein
MFVFDVDNKQKLREVYVDFYRAHELERVALDIKQKDEWLFWAILNDESALSIFTHNGTH